MDMKSKQYRGLLAMSLLSFGAMYVLMYSMVDEFGNVYSNVNQLYMAALMATPMVMIELVVKREMYVQLGVSDKQFLRSMIPLHPGAILMCERASLKDPELTKLCEAIVSSQRSEIAQMGTKLAALNK